LLSSCSSPFLFFRGDHYPLTLHYSQHTFSFFFFNDTATTEIYTLSLHDALPICGHPSRRASARRGSGDRAAAWRETDVRSRSASDRKSTRLNSSHVKISYAVFCLKKKKTQQ